MGFRNKFSSRLFTAASAIWKNRVRACMDERLIQKPSDILGLRPTLECILHECGGALTAFMVGK